MQHRCMSRVDSDIAEADDSRAPHRTIAFGDHCMTAVTSPFESVDVLWMKALSRLETSL